MIIQESMSDAPHVTLQLQYRKCGKDCKKCREGKGHGPYWYAYSRDGEGGKLRSRYVGKTLPESIAGKKDTPENVFTI